MNKNELKIEVSDFQKRVGIFKKVPASELSLEDDFLKYTPKTEMEMWFKMVVKNVIKAGVRDFWRPVCDPSFDDDGRICFEPGNMPAVLKSYNWWEKNAKDFWPERGSRLGTNHEYISFLAVLIKALVASGKSIEWAWNVVCNDSKELGHYWNSDKAKHTLEATGSREICGWCDLGNACKILAEDKEAGGFWLAGGNFVNFSDANPLVDFCLVDYRVNCDICSCGWIVLDSYPD